MPLSQISLFPNLLHVYFFPETIEVRPAFEQAVPAFAVANAVIVDEVLNIAAMNANPSAFFTLKWYLDQLDLSAIATKVNHGPESAIFSQKLRYSELRNKFGRSPPTRFCDSKTKRRFQ